MTAFTRLWRRAPAWRLCLVSALAASALAAMFPPAMPGVLARARTQAALLWQPASPDQGGTRPAAPQAGAARFVPPSAGRPQDAQGALELPAFGAGRSGITPFAGRQILLPDGVWQAVALARDAAQVPVQAEMFARIEQGRITGLLLAEAPNAVNGADQPLIGLAACFAPDSLAKAMAPEPFGADPSVHECWTLTPDAPQPTPDGLLARGLQRLEQMGIRAPSQAMALSYLRSGPTGWLTILLLLPDKQAGNATATHRQVAWARRYALALHAGFDRALPGKDAPPPGRDPP